MAFIINLLAILTALFTITIATPVQLFARSEPICNAMWPYGDVGTGGPVTIAGTENNIAHLSDVVYCKVPARTILRIACKDNSAIYVHNRENHETKYHCINYVNNAQHIVNSCRKEQGTFGPAWQDGGKWAMLLVGDRC